MAVTSLWAVHADGKRGAGTVIKQLTDYASNDFIFVIWLKLSFAVILKR